MPHPQYDLAARADIRCTLDGVSVNGMRKPGQPPGGPAATSNPPAGTRPAAPPVSELLRSLPDPVIGLDAGGIGVYLSKALTDGQPVRFFVRLQRRF